MKEEDMITIQIEAGCPSGRSEQDEIGFWNQSKTVTVHKKLVRDFIDNLMEYARQQAEAEQIGYFDVAAKGRQRDAVAIASAFEAQSDVKRQRDADAQNSLVNAFNLERNFYGDIPSYLIGDSPFVQGIGSVSPATNFSSILDVANVDFANQARFQQAQETLAQLRQDYASAQASGQVDKATQLKYDILKLESNIKAFTTGAEFLGELPGIIEDTGQAIGGGIQNLLKLVGIKSSPVDDVSSDYYESERAVSDLLE